MSKFGGLTEKYFKLEILRIFIRGVKLKSQVLYQFQAQIPGENPQNLECETFFGQTAKFGHWK